MKELSLPSGAILKIGDTPFSESKALFQSVLEEMKIMKLESSQDHVEVLKNIFCSGFSSKKIESALQVCLKRCLYNDSKIEDKLFDPVEARQDYIPMCIEVALENIGPFMKGLFVGLNQVSYVIPNSQTSRP